MSQDWKQLEVSSEWIKKMGVCIYRGFFSSRKRNSTICNNIDGPWGPYAKLNSSLQENANAICCHVYVESKKN